jgi:Tfp pilus assembly protein PilN
MKIIEVNLLPPEYAPESPYSLRNIIVLVLSFLLIGSLVVIAFQMLAMKESYMRENARLMTAISAFRKEKEKLDALLERRSELERRYRMLEKALGGRITWADKLAEICGVIPNEVWLQDISLQRMRVMTDVQDQEEQAEAVEVSLIKMTGQASGLKPIEELIRRLKGLSYIEDPNFTSIDRRSMAGHELYQFELTAQVGEGGGER